MEKPLIDRRMAQMSAEGVLFRPGVDVGRDVTGQALLAEFDAVVLAGGAVEDIEEPINAKFGIVPVSFFEAHELIEAGKERERLCRPDVQVLLPPDNEQ
jgi:hypothetical protein